MIINDEVVLVLVLSSLLSKNKVGDVGRLLLAYSPVSRTAGESSEEASIK
jgi:hypothetical protein